MLEEVCKEDRGGGLGHIQGRSQKKQEVLNTKVVRRYLRKNFFAVFRECSLQRQKKHA